MRSAVVFAFALLVVACHAQTPDPKCMAKYCKPQMMKCLGNKECRSMLTCMMKCGSDQACAFGCINSYEDDLFDDFMSCAIVDHQCIPLPPSNNTECKTVLPSVPGFELPMIENNWTVAYGHNPIYDCFNCSKFNYVPQGDSMTNTTYHSVYNVLTNEGKPRWETVTRPAWISTEQKSTIVNLGMMAGMAYEEHWSVIAMGKEADRPWAAIYYCGVTNDWTFDGAFVLVPQTKDLSPPVPLTDATMTALTEVYAKIDFTFPADFCELPEDCRGSPP